MYESIGICFDCTYINNHVHRAPFSDIERKKEVAKSKERRKEIHNTVRMKVWVFVSIVHTCTCTHDEIILFLPPSPECATPNTISRNDYVCDGTPHCDMCVDECHCRNPKTRTESCRNECGELSI